MTAQHAPTPRAFWQAAVWGWPLALYGTDQTAFTNAHSTRRKPHSTINAPSPSVTAVDHHEPNRLRRAQAQGPPVEAAGLRCSITGAAVAPVVAGTGSICAVPDTISAPPARCARCTSS